MPLAPGLHLGPYQVSALIGTGGMGEVYRATDTNLKRQVALKVLPASLAGDVERLARFQREAEVLAALNHPHIAQIYGLEKSAAVTALVMELVDGEDLSHRIARGAIPVDEALPIARQIADVLETAHEQGIVHRDLKPANIKVREDGTVKVLDFGLAKALDPVGITVGDVANSPTITSPAMTQIGMILGTAAYMSPEQARGKAVDKRTDIWAFGCVLYEMLTGQRAFQGEDVTETLAHVLTKEPDWRALPMGTPNSLRRLLGRCLERDPRRRLRDIGDGKWDLDDASAAGEPVAPSAPRHAAGRRLAAIVGFSVVTGAVAAGLAAAILLRPTPPTAAVGRFLITTPPNAPVVTEANLPTVAISPDGSRVMYRTSHGEQASAQTSAWYMRDRHQLVATSIRSSEGFGVNGGAFFSPDGEWIVFVAGLGGTLKRASMSGGPAETICPIDGGFAGGSWGDDGQIVFATTTSKGLRRVRAAGGEPEVLTTVDPASGDLDHRWPEVLPGGRGVVFTAWRGSAEASRIMARAPDGRISTLLSGGSHPRVTSTGLMVFAVDRTLRAVRFDATTLSVVQNPVTVIEGVGMTVAGAAHYAISAEGSLVYVGVGPDRPRTLIWVDRQGREEPTAVPARMYVGLRVSPDGTRAALDTRGQDDIYVWDFRRDTLERFTNDQSVNRLPTWNPDGSRLAFTAETDGTMHIYWQAADLSGTPERLSRGSTPHGPQSFSPDGKSLIFITHATPPYDLGVMQLVGEPREEMLLTSPFNESFGEVSPDGRWLAYQSDQSGRNEVHVRPFPNVRAGGTITVSTSGGTRPLWSKNGSELFYYVEPGTVMAVPVTLGQSLSVGKPAVVVKGRFSVSSITRRNYGVAPDGKRFLMMKDVETDGRDPRSPEIVLVQHWTDELQRLVPVN